MIPRRFIAARWLATLLLLAAWIGASNHCALGFMQGARAVREHAGCCGQNSQMPGAPAKSVPVKECCSALQTTVPATEEGLVSPPAFALLPSCAEIGLPQLSAPRATDGPAALETGPPGEARSFAELVLQASLRSHAPPSAA